MQWLLSKFPWVSIKYLALIDKNWYDNQAQVSKCQRNIVIMQMVIDFVHNEIWQ